MSSDRRPPTFDGLLDVPSAAQTTGLNARATCVVVAAITALSGCTSMSGLGGGSTYACKAPEGVACESVSGTYANAQQGNLPSQRQRASSRTDKASPRSPEGMTVAPRAPAGSGHPEPGLVDPQMARAQISRAEPAEAGGALRSFPRVIRLWIKPWEDADNDLHDQGYVYVQVDSGRWQLEHVQRQIRNAYAPLRPPGRTSTSPATRSEPAEPTQAAPEVRQSPGLTPPPGRPILPN